MTVCGELSNEGREGEGKGRGRRGGRRGVGEGERGRVGRLEGERK